MAEGESEVSRFIAASTHPRKAEIEELRRAILASNDSVTERIKWNAPSFGYGDTDRVTFRLQPGDRVELIFHRGAKVRADADEFRFEDPTGLLQWASPDRAILAVADAEDLKAKRGEIVRVVNLWLEATAG